jgi:chemosensory pili system protein ChpA (sensor histidine kinase/response regulator)
VRKDADLVANQALGSWAREVLAKLKRAPRVDDAEKIAPTMAHLGPQAETPSADAQRLKDASVERLDAELLAIFLEEAVSVLATIAENLALSRGQPASMAHLVTIRRSFHTLKGSGRMVGLARLAEAAWAVEQVMNLWLQQERSATPELLALVELAQGTFADWVARLQKGEPQPDAAAVLAAAERVRRGEPALAAAPPPAAAPEADVVIGPARISPSLYAVFVNEARQHLDTLERNLAAAAAGAPREEHTRAAHTLAGICGTVRIPAMQELGHALEVALGRLRDRPAAPVSGELDLLARSIAALREMYAAVVERREPAPRPDLARSLEAVTAAPAEPRATARPAEEPRPAATQVARAAPKEPLAGRVAEEVPLDRRERRIEDEVDAQLIPVFLEEAAELVPKVGELLRTWRAEEANFDHASALQRLLHTLKGSARMAGVMSLGELTHHMETRVGNAAALKLAPQQLFDDLETAYDRIGLLVERLQRRAAPAPEQPAAEAPAAKPARAAPAAPRTMLRVRTELVEKLVNQAGEVAITRARIEGEMRALKGSLAELTENVARLRRELREIEIQAESQMQARVREAEEAERPFDPLEIDRFTRFQEITRFMAESVNDLSTVHQHITRSVDDTDTALSVQARLTRELQQELMRVRMVPIGSLAERLHRLARQTAKELGKRVNLDIHGAQVELDRSVLERMAAPLEHMVRNAVIHGIEAPAARAAAGKPEMGEIHLDVGQEGNEVTLSFADDGAGLDLERIRARALAQGLLREGDPANEQSLAELVFVPGFSTAEVVTEIAGRGVGMDVVKNEVSSLGGRIELATTAGRGARFTIRLPLTTAVTQTVLVKSGNRICALPAVIVEQVQHLRGAELERARATGEYEWAGRRYPLAYLPELLGEPGNPEAAKRFQPVILLRSGVDSVALLVDEMLGNQENVVKNLGPQLARVPGVAGVTVLGSGEIVLILNPVPLARLGPRPQRAPTTVPLATAPARPKVMVVDDSLTVRKITGRLLAREGYEVLTAKDGVEALEQLAEVTPDVMLVDIEMPRMDGFDLTRNVRADARLKRVPIIMITSRTAAKHRAYAAELGVDVFLGKPYREEELLGHIASYLGG